MESFTNGISALAFAELPKNLHYSYTNQYSPVPFENRSSFSSPSFTNGPSQPFGPPDRFQMDAQLRRTSPYPLINGGDSVMLGRDWSGPSEVQMYGSTPWNSESACVQQGGPAGTQYGNTSTVHHFGALQNFQGLQRNSSCMQYGNHFLGDIDMCEIDRDLNGNLEQDCRVTSSTEVSPWKPLPHIPEFLNKMPCSSPFNWQCDRQSVSDGRHKGIQTNQYMTALNTSSTDVSEKKLAAETQTPWKLKKHKRHLSLQKAGGTNNTQKYGKKSQMRNTQNYIRQKAMQRRREYAIRDEVYKLHALLPWCVKDRKPSRNDILHKAIDYIGTLECKVGKICHEMGIVWPTHKADKKDCAVSSKSSNELIKFKNKDEKESPQIKQAFGGISEPIVTELDCLRSILDSPANSDNCTDISPHKVQEEGTAHVKRPMNAFLLFSKKHRKKYQEMYPDRDNRKITTRMAEDWNKMEADEKKPYKDKAEEEMRKKKANPRFKYSETKQSPRVVVCTSKKNDSNGFRVGNHTLRARKREGPTDNMSTKCVKLEEQGLVRDFVDGKSIHQTTSSIQKTNNSPEADVSDQLHITVKEEPNVVLETESPIKASGHKLKEDRVIQRNSHDNWVQCDVCSKWRMLLDHVDPANLPEKWFCWLNSDETCNDCLFPENSTQVRNGNPGSVQVSSIPLLKFLGHPSTE